MQVCLALDKIAFKMRLKRLLRSIWCNVHPLDVPSHFHGEEAAENEEKQPLMETREQSPKFNQVLAALVGKEI